MAFIEPIELIYEALSEDQIEKIMKSSYQDSTIINVILDNYWGEYLLSLYKDDILELKSYIREKRIKSILCHLEKQ